jgi:hypothetical protein
MAAIVAVSITMLILENKAIGHKMMAECHWILEAYPHSDQMHLL